ncbi:uncharacterized protein N7482_007926 [Penicillium canariense]|uniref:Zn(2)-C6 fungal-type domain-containing protein n=1 Tax=Penicillium canariense TaxID=189055 RepID=A0A9W9LJM6_9EURO|nr:uncharacterized protein N7482_007926 [Penicillium canariense]KAJ5160922.1 hypothetical protein N7482_007926 [Penicillium canariense]
MTSPTPGTSTGAQDGWLSRQSPAPIRGTILAKPMPTPKHVTASLELAQPPAVSRGICSRIAQWLWPDGWGHSGEPPSLFAGTRSQQSASRPPLHIQSYASASLDCMACREWNVACDHSRPQCEHCYQQQILCFYVSPKQMPKRKARRVEPATGDVATVSEQRAHLPDAPATVTV